MIELVLYNYLLSNLSSPVFMEIPKTNIPSKFYVIEKTGGSEENHIFSSTFAIKSYAGTLFDAAKLNDDLKAVMLDGLITRPEIASVDLNSDYNFTDTTTKKYRYQAVFDIVHY